jgi:hypothetical protein
MPVDPAVFDADLPPHAGPGARRPNRPPHTHGAEYLAPDDVAERLAEHGPSDADQILAGASLFQRVERSPMSRECAKRGVHIHGRRAFGFAEFSAQTAGLAAVFRRTSPCARRRTGRGG